MTTGSSDAVQDPVRVAEVQRFALLSAPAEASFDRVTRTAALALRAPVALVSLVDADRQILRGCVGLPEPWASRREIPLSHSFCQHVVETCDPLVIADARTHPLVRDNPAVRDLAVVAYAGIPLVTSNGLTLGSFCVIDREPRHWTAEEMALLRELASAAMTELELRAEVADRERAEERLRFLAEAGEEIAASLDERSTLRRITSLAVPALADHCAVDIVRENGRIARVKVAFSPPLERRLMRKLRQQHAPDWESPQPAATAIRTQQTVWVAEMTAGWLADHARDAEHLAILRGLGIRSLVSVPLVARGQVLGAITLTTGPSERLFDPDDVQLVEELARRIALAFDHARQYQNARQAVRAREDVLAVVSRELGGPLGVIRQSTEGLAEDLTPGAWPRERRHVESVRRSTDQMSRMLGDLLDFTRIKAGRFAIHPDLVAIADLHAAMLGLLAPLTVSGNSRVEFHLPDGLPNLLADQQRLLQALCSLVAHAARLAPEGGVIGVSAAAIGVDVRFSVSIPGAHIAREQTRRMFERPTSWTGAEGGAGLVLAVTREIVEAHGGRIWVAHAEDGGSAFFLSVPIAQEDDTGTAQEAEFRDITSSAGDETARVPGAAGEVDFSIRERGGRGEVRRALWHTDLLTTGHREQGSAADRRTEFAARLRERIRGALHMGSLQPGDRLPSVREMMQQGVAHGTVVWAYQALEDEGWIEARARSGVYVAQQEAPRGETYGETARWLAGLLTSACEHQIKLPALPELIHRWTATVRLRCACIESDEDHLVALCTESGQHFGVDSRPVPFATLGAHERQRAVEADKLPEEVRRADLLLTTMFHAPAVRGIAEALGKPLVVAVVNSQVTRAVEHRLERGRLTVVCADAGFGERMRAVGGGASPDRIRVVLARDGSELTGLDPSEPVLLTRAARDRLGVVNLRLLVSPTSFLSPSYARTFSEVLIRLNMEAARR